ncbi:hypothetical protein BJF78_20000 [Pseudonocardia sp. CNS-139]|nr:hypothetical protein BJF78_20000 [Pseudonocardia sp. CNS-139]
MTVGAEDVRTVVGAAVTALAAGRDLDWSVPAGDLTWSCWETAEHVADDLFAYAVQLAAGDTRDYLPFDLTTRRPGGEDTAIHARPEDGVDGLLTVVSACGALLAAVVTAAPPDARGFHTFGLADAEATAAMGVLETAVHTDDLARGLGLRWQPDDDLCARVLARLMPDVDRAGVPGWAALRWATGRGELPGRPRRAADWRWYNEPR